MRSFNPSDCHSALEDRKPLHPMQESFCRVANKPAALLSEAKRHNASICPLAAKAGVQFWPDSVLCPQLVECNPIPELTKFIKSPSVKVKNLGMTKKYIQAIQIGWKFIIISSFSGAVIIHGLLRFYQEAKGQSRILCGQVGPCGSSE